MCGRTGTTTTHIDPSLDPHTLCCFLALTSRALSLCVFVGGRDSLLGVEVRCVTLRHAVFPRHINSHFRNDSCSDRWVKNGFPPPPPAPCRCLRRVASARRFPPIRYDSKSHIRILGCLSVVWCDEFRHDTALQLVRRATKSSSPFRRVNSSWVIIASCVFELKLVPRQQCRMCSKAYCAATPISRRDFFASSVCVSTTCCSICPVTAYLPHPSQFLL